MSLPASKPGVLQGHQDPDVDAKVAAGSCHSTSMSQLSRNLLLQLLVSKKWRMCASLFYWVSCSRVDVIAHVRGSVRLFRSQTESRASPANSYTRHYGLQKPVRPCDLPVFVVRVQDKRVSVDIAIIKQSMSRAGLRIRWVPTELMVCDALTKDRADPADLLRENSFC